MWEAITVVDNMWKHLPWEIARYILGTNGINGPPALHISSRVSETMKDWASLLCGSLKWAAARLYASISVKKMRIAIVCRHYKLGPFWWQCCTCVAQWRYTVRRPHRAVILRAWSMVRDVIPPTTGTVRCLLTCLSTSSLCSTSWFLVGGRFPPHQCSTLITHAPTDTTPMQDTMKLLVVKVLQTWVMILLVVIYRCTCMVYGDKKKRRAGFEIYHRPGRDTQTLRGATKQQKQGKMMWDM